jgi:hypothetical protein
MEDLCRELHVWLWPTAALCAACWQGRADSDLQAVSARLVRNMREDEIVLLGPVQLAVCLLQCSAGASLFEACCCSAPFIRAVLTLT